MDKKFKIVVSITLALLSIIVVVGMYLVLMTRPLNDEKNNDQQATVLSAKDKEMVYLSQPINANLKMGTNNIPHMVRLVIGMEVNKKDKNYKVVMKDFSDYELLMRHKIIETVRSKTYEEMMDESAQNTLSNTIRGTINELLDTELIQNIYFGEFFIQ